MTTKTTIPTASERVWTLRIDGHERPCSWLPHVGPQSVVIVNEAVTLAKARGLTVIVNYERRGAWFDGFVSAQR